MTDLASPAARVDLSDARFWELPAEHRDAAFAVLRDRAPVCWQRPADPALIPSSETGYWAVTRHADVRTVSRDARTFRAEGEELFGGVPAELRDPVSSFVMSTHHRHRKVRALVGAAFGQRHAHRIVAQARDHARQIADELQALGEFDFVAHVSTRLPTMLVEEAQSHAELDLQTIAERTRKAREESAQPGGEPGGGLTSALALAEIDGERLTPQEIAAFWVLVSIGGTDTTRQTISHALWALTRFPDQRRLLLEDLAGRIGDAVEEFLRWATPLMAYRRTATEDTVLAGERIAAGDQLLLFYISANRDERVFAHPERFDVSRAPNQHLAFGGGGVHYCLGAPLARIRLRALFTELLRRFPEIEAETPEFSSGHFMNRIERMRCRLGPHSPGQVQNARRLG